LEAIVNPIGIRGREERQTIERKKCDSLRFGGEGRFSSLKDALIKMGEARKAIKGSILGDFPVDFYFIACLLSHFTDSCFFWKLSLVNSSSR
jgi:hypothetical protein